MVKVFDLSSEAASLQGSGKSISGFNAESGLDLKSQSVPCLNTVESQELAYSSFKDKEGDKQPECSSATL